MSTTPPTLQQLQRVPYLRHGRSLAGADCVGLVWLYHSSIARRPIPEPVPCQSTASAPPAYDRPEPREPGDVLFFRSAGGTIIHVGIYTEDRRILHSMAPVGVRIDNDTKLLRRCKIELAGVISANNTQALIAALSASRLGFDGGIGLAILLFSVLAGGLALTAGFMGGKKSGLTTTPQAGSYGYDPFATANSSQLPLPVLLGRARTVGNSIFTTPKFPNFTVDDPVLQTFSRLVVVSTAVIEDLNDLDIPIQINGMDHTDDFWSRAGGAGGGYVLDPAQTYEEAILGQIGGATGCPSITLYRGDPDTSVPVDIRSHYLREAPIHGLSGCAYLWLTGVNQSKYSKGWNVQVTAKGVKCREFNASGWITTSATDTIAGDTTGPARYKLSHSDIASVSSVTAGGVTMTAASPTNQTGNIYHINILKGWVWLPAAVTGNVVVAYTYHPKSWTQNPVRQVVSLLTDTRFGKGVPPDKIDWESAADTADYCDELVTRQTSVGFSVLPRYQSNYTLDTADTIQSHLEKICDAFDGFIVVSGGRLKIRTRQTGASLISFTPDNIIASTFTAELQDRTSAANRVKVAYRSVETLNVETEVVVDDPANQSARALRAGNLGVVEDRMTLPACGTEAHARALGDQALALGLRVRWLCSLKTTLRALPLEPGDVVDVTHPVMPAWQAKKFWVDTTSVSEDGQTELTLAEYIDLPQ